MASPVTACTAKATDILKNIFGLFLKRDWIERRTNWKLLIKLTIISLAIVYNKIFVTNNWLNLPSTRSKSSQIICFIECQSQVFKISTKSDCNTLSKYKEI